QDERETMKGYKGFSPGMVCRGKQYQENTEFTEPKAKICESGMHFCPNPFDVWSFYPPADENGNLNEFAEVEAMDDSQTDDDIKYCSSRLRIGAKLDLPGFIKAGVDFILEHVKSTDSNTGYQSAATNTGSRSAATNTGDQSAATNTGDRSAATNTGYRSTAPNTGNWSAAANTGDQCAAASTGYRSTVANTCSRSAATNTGDYSTAANTGDYSASTNTGECSAATNTGDRSASTNTGYRSTASVSGNESFAIATGYQGKVKGALGCWIACAEWAEDDNGNWHPVGFKAVRVDGKKIKADTWYRLEKGKFIEVKEE
ncbi:DUF7666 domain-containing protein, partial [Victivallis vadensis]|uniref:DUF7666 domain-containing protein n=1 Tax=Victivallis vadensis TaxID=172901 RepID=UPI003AF4488A